MTESQSLLLLGEGMLNARSLGKTFAIAWMFSMDSSWLAKRKKKKKENHFLDRPTKLLLTRSTDWLIKNHLTMIKKVPIGFADLCKTVYADGSVMGSSYL